MFATQGRSGPGLRWFIEIETSPTCGASLREAAVVPELDVVERAVNGVDDRRRDEAAHHRGELRRVVVDDVELVRVLVAGQRVVELDPGRPDRVQRRLGEGGHELRARARVA